jgi:hypothetical protein
VGKRRVLAGVVVSAALVLGSGAVVASPGPLAAGHTDGVTPALPAPVTVPAATLPPPATSAVIPCEPSQVRVTQQSFKVALGTVVGTYRVESDGKACAVSVDDRNLLAAIDGGAPPTNAVLRSPGVVDITFANPNIHASTPAQPLPSLPPLTVPPTTLPTLPPTTLPNVQALQPVVSAVDSVTNLLHPTTTTPPPPPPPPRSPDTGPAAYPSSASGFDISWPQCGNGYPPSAAVAVVGVNDGRPFTDNPCLQSEVGWAGGARELYMNLNSPSAVDSSDSAGPWGQCAPSDVHCLAYTYGWNAAEGAYTMAASKGVHAKTWWLDVEVVGKCSAQFPTGGSGYWACDKGLNMATVQGALDALRARNLVAGIYSTSYQYDQIAGSVTPNGGAPPNWLAGASPTNPAGWCSGSHDFAGGPPWLLQFSPNPWDRDQAC